jgi:hypothetical protein
MCLQDEKQKLPRILTERGIQILRNKQDENAQSSIRSSRDSGPNVILASGMFLKHPVLRISTELGIELDFNVDCVKDNSPTSLKLEPPSNPSSYIVASAKQNRERCSTDAGMDIDGKRQERKQLSLMSRNFERGSNVSFSIFAFRKHDFERV